jgi:AraC-like DNA-binding protein
MDYLFDIWSVFLLLGIFQSGLILPFLFRKRNASGFWLGMLVLMLTLSMLNFLLIHLHVYRLWPHFADLTFPVIFLIGPFYYLYVRSLLNKHFQFQRKDLLHFIPFLSAYLLRWDFYSLSAAEKIRGLDWVLAQDSIPVGITFLIPVGIHVLQTLIYMFLVNEQLKQVNLSSNALDLQFRKWLKYFTWGFSVYWIATFLWLLYLTTAQAVSHVVDYIFILMTAFLVNILAYQAIYRQREFSQYLLAMIHEKYKRSSLSSEQSKGMLRRLIHLMEEEKPYLNPELRISTIAEKMNTTTNILSQVLNQELKKNYFDFINEYRIAEAMRKLSDPEYSHISIFGIAQDSGFKNKNTFNRLFKKHTNQTPSQFIRSHSG